MKKLLDYLKSEGEEQINKDDLTFICTAKVADEKYWVWEFSDSENKKCYVTVSQKPGGCTYISYDEDHCGLSPEQFILGMYHNVF